MTKLYFITLIEHDDDAEFFETLLNQNCIDFECNVIGDKDLVYEFKINQENKQFVRFIINTHCINVLDFVST